MNVSFILPTRGRFDALKQSVDSIVSNASSSDFEILLALDDDDHDTLDRLRTEGMLAACRCFVGQRIGYRNLQHYVNSLCEFASGNWLFLWNDDAIMETNGWDEIVRAYDNQFLLLNPNSNHNNHVDESCIFPIIPSTWFRTVGHFSLSNHNDTWVELIAKRLGIVRNIPIYVLHDRVDLTGGNDDQTSREREFSTNEFYSEEIQAQIQRDCERLHAEFVAKSTPTKDVGFVGLGKLGLPCALAIENRSGQTVVGFDQSEEVRRRIEQRSLLQFEPGANELLRHSKLELCSIEDIVERCDIVFVAVQTPHLPEFEGISALPQERADFDYSFLRTAISEISAASEKRTSPVTLVVISTVLPGTIAREIEPLLSPTCKLCYNPFFIAMGSTLHDFLNPEFVLLGARDSATTATLREFYAKIHDAPCYVTTIEAAELIKVSYNTFIGMKIAFANSLMEICDKTGINVDDVTGALTKATDRLISPRYLRTGMGDGGGCHPRDNIAMSFLARDLDLSFDIFESTMLAREGHTRWLVDETKTLANKTGLPVTILGRSYKAGTNLVAGSPALLLHNLLSEVWGVADIYDPHIDATPPSYDSARVFFLATPHKQFADLAFPEGSYLIDPWGIQVDRPGLHVIRLGRRTTK